MQQTILIALKVGLRISTKKANIMTINNNNNNALVLKEVVMEDVKSFCYLGCKISHNSSTDEDVTKRIHSLGLALLKKDMNPQ